MKVKNLFKLIRPVMTNIDISTRQLIKGFVLMDEIYARGLGKKQPILKKILFYLSQKIPSKVKNYGVIYHDPMSIIKELYMYGEIEPLHTSVVEKLLKPGDVALDIGANIGYYTLLFSKLVGLKGKVFSFEPHPKNFFYLLKNIKINKLTNVIPFMKAVSAFTGNGYLYEDPASCFDHRIIYTPSRRIIKIELVRLDDIEFENVNLIKMDIQGSEMLAVIGAKETIKKYKPHIITEFAPDLIRQTGHDPLSFLNFFYKIGYDIFELNYDNNSLIRIRENSAIKLIEKLKNGKWTNLLIVKRKL